MDLTMVTGIKLKYTLPKKLECVCNMDSCNSGQLLMKEILCDYEIHRKLLKDGYRIFYKKNGRKLIADQEHNLNLDKKEDYGEIIL